MVKSHDFRKSVHEVTLGHPVFWLRVRKKSHDFGKTGHEVTPGHPVFGLGHEGKVMIIENLDMR